MANGVVAARMCSATQPCVRGEMALVSLLRQAPTGDAARVGRCCFPVLVRACTAPGGRPRHADTSLPVAANTILKKRGAPCEPAHRQRAVFETCVYCCTATWRYAGFERRSSSNAIVCCSRDAPMYHTRWLGPSEVETALSIELWSRPRVCGRDGMSPTPARIRPWPLTVAGSVQGARTGHSRLFPLWRNHSIAWYEWHPERQHPRSQRIQAPRHGWFAAVGVHCTAVLRLIIVASDAV